MLPRRGATSVVPLAQQFLNRGLNVICEQSTPVAAENEVITSFLVLGQPETFPTTSVLCVTGWTWGKMRMVWTSLTHRGHLVLVSLAFNSLQSLKVNVGLGFLLP